MTTYLEGENKISINKSGKSSSSPAGISVAKDAKLTIDSEPEQPGSIEVLNEYNSNQKLVQQLEEMEERMQEPFTSRGEL